MFYFSGSSGFLFEHISGKRKEEKKEMFLFLKNFDFCKKKNIPKIFRKRIRSSRIIFFSFLEKRVFCKEELSH